MEKIKGDDYCYTVSDVAVWDDGGSESFYQELDIGKDANDRLLESFWPAGLRVI